MQSRFSASTRMEFYIQIGEEICMTMVMGWGEVGGRLGDLLD